MLRLENISWSSPDNRAILRGVDLTVPDSKLVVITGPNGGGKTTLAKKIAGIVKPDTGRILLDDEDITEHDVTRRAREGISYAFQQPVRFKGITVRQLIETAAGETLEYKRLCEILGNVGLCAKNYLDREVNATLSGGEIKRIELATVLARHTRLSVFDEPEAGIDLWSFKNLISVFKNMRENLSGTLIIISHQERILRIADEIVMIADGHITAQGRGEDMLERVLSSGGIQTACCKEEEIFDE